MVERERYDHVGVCAAAGQVYIHVRPEEMRFVSPYIAVWWALRTVDHYVPFLNVEVVGLMLCMYSVGVSSLYILNMFRVWQTQLLAMGTDESVGNTFLVAEWLVTCGASACSVYWIVDTGIPVEVFVFVCTVSVGGHFALEYTWQKYLKSFMFQYSDHLAEPHA